MQIEMFLRALSKNLRFKVFSRKYLTCDPRECPQDQKPR